MSKYSYNDDASPFVGCMEIFYIFLMMFGFAGWIMNIVKVVHLANDPITGIFILRCVGVIAAPLGAFMGWIK